jgi:hypothetical protein
MSKADDRDITITMGDFNASMGVSTGQHDLFCGKHGVSHQNESGRRLKSFAGMNDLVDLVSWEEQVAQATHYDI